MADSLRLSVKLIRYRIKKSDRIDVDVLALLNLENPKMVKWLLLGYD